MFIETFLISLAAGAYAKHLHHKHLETDKNSSETVVSKPESRCVWVETEYGLTFRTIPDGVSYEEYAKTYKITTPKEHEEEQERKIQEIEANRSPEMRKWWAEVEEMRRNIRKRFNKKQKAVRKALEYKEPPLEFYDRESIERLIYKGLDHRSSEMEAKQPFLVDQGVYNEQTGRITSFWG